MENIVLVGDQISWGGVAVGRKSGAARESEFDPARALDARRETELFRIAAVLTEWDGQSPE